MEVVECSLSLVLPLCHSKIDVRMGLTYHSGANGSSEAPTMTQRRAQFTGGGFGQAARARVQLSSIVTSVVAACSNPKPMHTVEGISSRFWAIGNSDSVDQRSR